MQRFRFVGASSMQTISQSDLAKAKVLSDIDSIINASSRQGEYVFSKSEELEKKLNPQSVSITIETLKSGNLVNRCVVTRMDGRKINARTFGKGREHVEPAKVIEGETLKKLSFGFCMSDGEIVTESGFDASGTLCKRPVIYVNISALPENANANADL